MDDNLPREGAMKYYGIVVRRPDGSFRYQIIPWREGLQELRWHLGKRGDRVYKIRAFDTLIEGRRHTEEMLGSVLWILRSHEDPKPAADPPDTKSLEGGYRVYPKGKLYKGELSRGKPHGSGSMFYPDGSRYEGEFQMGKRHGQGVFVKPNGFRYEGDWEEDRPNGLGKRTDEGGWIHIGEFRNGHYVSNERRHRELELRSEEEIWLERNGRVH